MNQPPRKPRVIVLLAHIAAVVAAFAPLPTAIAEQPRAVFRHWEVFTSRDGLAHDSVRALFVERDRIWVGTDGGLAVSRSRKWVACKEAELARGELPVAVSAIDLDRNTGDIWFGTLGSGLYRYSTGRLDRFDQLSSGLAGNVVYDITVAGGVITAATNGGVSVFEPRAHTWSLCGERAYGRVDQVVVDLFGQWDHGAVTAAVWLGGLSDIDTAQRDAPGGLVISQPNRLTIAASRLGETTWLLTGDRLRRCEGDDVWEDYILPFGRARAVAACSSKRALVVADHALGVLVVGSPPAWVVYANGAEPDAPLDVQGNSGSTIAAKVVRAELPPGRIRCAVIDGRDIWVGASGGLAHGCVDADGLWRSARARSTDRTATAPGKQPDAIRIGVLFAANPTIALPGVRRSPRRTIDLAAVQLAIDDANARSDRRGGARYELVHDLHGYARYGWTLPEDDLATLAFGSDVSGIVALIMPGDLHMAALAQRAETPIVNAATNGPALPDCVTRWVFAVPDHRAARTIVARDDEDFAARYRAKYRRTSEGTALRSYRATQHLLHAIEQVGADCERIGEHLRTAVE